MGSALPLIRDEQAKQAFLRVAEQQPSHDLIGVAQQTQRLSLIANIVELQLDGDTDEVTWNLMHKRTWIFGPIPLEHNRRLACSDNPELASRILDERELRTSTSSSSLY